MITNALILAATMAALCGLVLLVAGINKLAERILYRRKTWRDL